MVTCGEVAAQKSEEKYGLVVSQTRSAASAVEMASMVLCDKKKSKKLRLNKQGSGHVDRS